MSKEPSDGPRPKNRKRVRRSEEVERNTCPNGHTVLEPRLAKKCKVCRYLRNQKNEQAAIAKNLGVGQDGHDQDDHFLEEGIGGNVAREATEPPSPKRSETGGDTPSSTTPTEGKSLEAGSSGIVPVDGFDPKRDHFRQGRKPWQPTEHLPGTEGKIEVLAERASLGQDLWHPLDATWGVRRGYGVYHDEV